MLKRKGWFSLVVAIFTAPIFANEVSQTNSPEIVRIVKSSPNDNNSHVYYSALLELALKKTETTHRPAKLQEITELLVQERAMRELNNQGAIDVFWTVTSIKRELQAITVRVPLLEGVMGYRVSLILDSKTNLFSATKSVKDIKDYVAGQGHDWPDFQILSANNFKVLGTSAYDSIIELLRKKRIDYFPRAINEAPVEVEALDDPDIVVEPNFLFYYPSYIFFFVSKSKPELAQRIEEGLLIAKRDGSFQRLFNDYLDVELLKSKLNLANRKVIRLVNPLLSQKTARFSSTVPLSLLSELEPVSMRTKAHTETLANYNTESN